MSPRLRVSVWKTFLPSALGFIVAITVLGGFAESFLRHFPPTDYEPYLGDASPRRGPFVADDAFGVTYRTFDDFVAENDGPMQRFLPLAAPGPPLWAFFGNSFVQAPGMLADTLRASVPDRRIFHLGRNEDLFVRFAQIALLLNHGWRPQRIVVALMPVDLVGLGPQPLATLQVTAGGAISYRPRLPDGRMGSLVARSAVARAAWFRAGRQCGNPDFDPRRLLEHIDEPLLSDVRRLFTNLAHVARSAAVPVTVLLVPTYQQILHGAGYGFQDTLTPLLNDLGYDVFDPRDTLTRAASPALFAPDWHFSPAGNELLANALLAHLQQPHEPAPAR